MQLFDKGKPPLGVVFDCDMGNDIGDALALALLYGLEGKDEARVISVSVTKSNLKAAAYADALMRFYSSAPTTGPFAGFSRTLPVGLSDTGWAKDDTQLLTEPLGKKKPDGSFLYNRTVRSINDTAEVSALIRNAMSSQYDDNCVVVLTGPATNLVKSMELPGVKDLIARKVRMLSFATDSNIQADIPAAKKLFAEWPSPIVTLGPEHLKFPAASIEKDFAWSEAHPVVDAYRAAKPMPYDAPAGDMGAVLYAVRPLEGYFKLSAAGTMSVLDNGQIKFAESDKGRHRYLIFDAAQEEKLVKAFTELASAKPVVRSFRPPKV
jgi:hypothetical protein